jgi:hypothetical protein
MQKGLALILIVLHLGTNTELVQVFKLPKLISHYFQHHRQNPSLSFSHFLAMHYGGDDGTTADDDMDSQLPFHNTIHGCLPVVYFPLIQEPVNINPPESLSIQHSSFLQLSKTNGHVASLLRPPLFS